MKIEFIIKQAFEKANLSQKNQLLTQVKDIYTAIVTQNDSDSNTHNLLGLCHYELEDFEKGIQAIKRAIELNPNEINFYLDLGNGYKKTKNYKEALIYFKKANKVDKKCYICHHNLADTYNKLNKNELCFFHLQKAIKIYPDFYEALFSMAQYHRRMKNEKKMVEYLQKTLEKSPKHPGANHLLASHQGQTHSPYSLEYTRDLFDRYADHFEEHLTTSLRYQVPIIIKEKLISLKLSQNSKVLDLGCGTGLLGKTIGDLFPNIVGVDISSNMIEETRKKQLYTLLHTGDIHDFLLENKQEFELIIAADVYIYIGDLQIIFSCVKKSLASNGYFIFTIQLSNELDMEGYQLGKSGRFCHSIKYIETLCKDIGFEIVQKEEIILRQENKKGQKGVIFVLTTL